MTDLNMDVVEPSLPMDRIDSEEPKSVKSITDKAEPNLAIALKLIPLPQDK
jgi:hypothetical protein